MTDKKIIKPRKLAGFRDFFAEDCLLRQKIAQIMENVFKSFGYDPIENPALEYAQILRGKAGEEEKLGYYFKDKGDRKIGLRYDQTVPLARFVAEYPNLPQPFKRYQLQKVWRADKPQKGRYREFYQFDFDIVNSDTILADAETCQILYQTMKTLGFVDFIIKINNRQILTSFTEYLGICTALKSRIFRTIDKLSKIGLEAVKNELVSLKIKQAIIAKIINLISIKGSNQEILFKLKIKLENVKSGQEAIKQLEKMLNLLKIMDIEEQYLQIDPFMVRGLDYYTGVIFEVIADKTSKLSVGGGGRYDQLMSLFSKKQIPAIGIGWGFDRLVDLIKERKIIKIKKTSTQILVTIFSAEYLEKSIKIANQLRKQGLAIEIYLNPKEKLNKQFKYADKKGIPYVIILGPDEVKANKITIKNMKTGKQTTLPKKEMLSFNFL